MRQDLFNSLDEFYEFTDNQEQIIEKMKEIILLCTPLITCVINNCYD